MTPHSRAGISPIRARLGLTCGVVLVIGGLTHLVVNLTGARSSGPDLLPVYVVLVVSAGLLGVWRMHGWTRGLQLGMAALAAGSALALGATSNPAAQRVEHDVALALVLTYSLLWASKPLRGPLRNGLDAAQFGIGVFIAEQLAAFGVGDLLLIAWPDLAHRSWPLSIVGGLVEEGCLLLVLGVYALAAPRLVDWPGLHMPGLRWTAWRPIVVAALQVEFGVIVFQLLVGLALPVAHVDPASVGNATFPAPGDWQPSVPVALLLQAILPARSKSSSFAASSSEPSARPRRLWSRW